MYGDVEEPQVNNNKKLPMIKVIICKEQLS